MARYKKFSKQKQFLGCENELFILKLFIKKEKKVKSLLSSL